MVFGATGGRPQTKKPITIQERLGDDRLKSIHISRAGEYQLIIGGHRRVY
jgi:hypothetical protein